MNATKPARKPNPYDAFVGSRLRACRTLAGFSQERLGETVGLSFQQIQKYEKGLNRIGASRLQQFSNILNVPPAYFFDGIQNVDGAAPVAHILSAANGNEVLHAKSADVSTRQTLELVRYFTSIEDEKFRTAFAALVEGIARSFERAKQAEATDAAEIPVIADMPAAAD
jgi:transcriptional regulator with XRE-family HTH domain